MVQFNYKGLHNKNSHLQSIVNDAPVKRKKKNKSIKINCGTKDVPYLCK